MSRTNIELDDKIVKEAMSFGNFKTKRALVHSALVELVKRLKRKEILRLMGSGCWEGDLVKMRRGRF
ncbi:MAG: type II toxin-antitoxin system VapB family antitoxin [Candidatus Omnitrophica bacterium]|nr:type II toxin-antitoxin system VapB family antitoxin [Candidatus Omnitrophota bacterium]MBU4303041.1 type II toxin-antitoxin system VapB family antitoxin [Candidatus Omnitrophota bacterium]MBU4418674.1 type II toxin-antitoxin system VapB family antitoxin [Candidatus Omnitrophota bacterium]MBU4468179.1 type II toxin-antitoxin system VapB family antitoxin [Candidatus Omnitrophota bacterium]MCG2707374.1 type II toxin-antitoxin system VapB family antitoxin [Candidatus Omnitrophota bacterium]